MKKENRRKFIYIFFKVHFPTHINAFKIFFSTEKHQLIYKKAFYITTDVVSISNLEMHKIIKIISIGYLNLKMCGFMGNV